LRLIKFLQTRILYAVICVAIVPVSQTRASEDSLNLAQCYANSSLTVTYFDTLPTRRLAKIIPYITEELSKIKDTGFIHSNGDLYYITWAHLHFLKARVLFENKTEITRAFLLQCKAHLDSAIFCFNKRRDITYREVNYYYAFAGYDSESAFSLQSSIEKLKDRLALYFNKDIYPDFKRIFLTGKKEHRYYFDSLKYYAGLYNLPLDFFIKENREPRKRSLRLFSVRDEYTLSPPLDLISQFLQFAFIIDTKQPVDFVNLYFAFENFIRKLKPKSNSTFGVPSNIPKDEFFRKNLNSEVCNRLYKALKHKFPKGKYSELSNSKHMNLPKRAGKYYFPIPPPFPSSKYAINHFAPGLKTIREVDNYIRKSFHDAGYAGRLHYYYIEYPGFAVATDIERINKDGSPTKEDTRWNLKMSNDGKLTLRQIFKSIFFATESDFRMIACIVAPLEIETGSSRNKVSASAMADLLKNSYSSLPLDLEGVILPEKTLTILVYHFNQSDIGEVPVLASSKLVVPQHLRKTFPLEQLIK
jgi:hypothetical protein